MDELLTADALVALLTLSVMEIVLGIDNVVFISILAGRLPADQQAKVRRFGLGLALVARLALLFAISWVMKLDKTVLFTIPLPAHAVTGKDLVLLLGGLFLIAKSTHEIYEKLEGAHGGREGDGRRASIGALLAQIVALDIVFSLDSVITAVGMARQIPVMVAAMLIAVVVMLVFAGTISGFVNRHPSVKILALSFLLLIGVMLTADGLGQHVPKGYIYFAMAFSLMVELLNMRFRKRQQPVHLHPAYEEGKA
ncbi:MAG TPA: TerC family protein [Planctomycetota bacterium]|nr:TerC family protein [Planctomycetota bacterium]